MTKDVGVKDIHVGIDLGTSGVRVAAIDTRGRLMRMLGHRWPRGQALSPPTWEHLTLWLLDHLFRSIGRADIRTIAVDGTSGTVLLCSPTGRPLSPVLAYNDNRAIHEAASAQSALSLAPAAQGPHGGPAKLLWLINHLPPLPAGAQAFPQSPWLTGRLLGSMRFCDAHNALKLGAHNGIWAPGLKTLGLASLLPHIIEPGHILGPLRTALVRRFHLRHTPLIVAGTTDSIAGFLALSPLPIGMGVTSLGSTLALKLASDRPIFVPDLGIYSHRLQTTWLTGGASNSGGAVLTHYFPPDTLEVLSAQLPLPQSPSLNYYPLLQPGERLPVNDPHYAPRLSPRPPDDRQFLQGLLEGLAAIEARGYQILHDHGAPPLRAVTTVGGGARNKAWRWLREQALGVPVYNAPHREAAWGVAQLGRRQNF